MLNNKDNLKWLGIFYGISIFALLLWYISWVDGTNHSIISFISDQIHLAIIGVYVTAIMPLFQIGLNLYYQKKIEEKKKIESRKRGNHLLSLKHKDMVNMLDRFGGDVKYNYLGEDTIYGTMIDVLERLKNEPDTENSKRKLHIFLCSPVLDTPNRVDGKYENWGIQFSNLITELCRKPNMKDKVHICFLSDDVKLGFKPLHGFIEVLANYCVDFEKKKIGNQVKSTIKCNTVNHDTIYKAIEKQTTDVYNKIIQEHGKEKVRLLEDIPFQMIITETDKFAEVVVSFAGRTILEYEKSKEPKGFHSIDPDVVNAFKQIFDAYANKENRTPLNPNSAQFR